jgi:hypothetical protein
MHAALIGPDCRRRFDGGIIYRQRMLVLIAVERPKPVHFNAPNGNSFTGDAQIWLMKN